MKIALSTDHAGFEEIKTLEKFLTSKGYECVNYGPKQLDMADDYPDFILPAAQAVGRGECEVGILWGGSGQGEAMVANRVKGVRCAVYYGPAVAKRAINAEGIMAKDNFEILRLSKDHNNANMLSLAARFLDDLDIQNAVTIWLDSEFEGLQRHARRIKKIDGLN